MGGERGMPLYSVITVVRDDVGGLIRSHTSLAGQSCRDFEWIVVDGGSRDGGREWLEAHQGEIAWWRSAPDGGIYDAMTIGLGVATGAYVLFLNAGDEFAGSEVLGRAAAALAHAGWPDFAYGDAWEGAPGGRLRLKPARSHRWAWYGMFTHHQAMFCRRAILDGLFFDPAYPIRADYAFILEVLKRALGILYLPFPVCIFATGGCSQRQAAAGRRDQSVIRKRVLNHSLIRRALIHAIQLAAHVARKAMPILFYALRCKGGI